MIGQRTDSRLDAEHLLSCERAYGDVAMLACSISNLTGFWLGVVAWRGFATDVRIKMGQGPCAISTGWDWLIVDIVHYASGIRKLGREE